MGNEEGSTVLLPDRDVAQDDEVFISYGDKTGGGGGEFY